MQGKRNMKLYVLVRNDLKPAYRACQAGHVVAQWLLEFGQEKWKNETLIYLGVNDEEELNYWCNKLNEKGFEWAGFREPDIGNELTGIACLSDGREFKRLKLISD